MSWEQHIPVLPHQGEMLASTAPNIAHPAGLGSGKSRGAVAKGAQLAQANHPYPGFIIEPTRGHIRNVIVPEFHEFAQEIGGHFVHRKSESKGILYLGDGERYEIVFFSGDRPEGVVGINAAWGIVDEAGHQKDDLLKNARARVRHPKAKQRQYIEMGTPEEFNGFYEFCEGSPPEGLHLIRAKTTDNFFLSPSPEEYIKLRFSHFTDEEIARYMEGRFVARHGRVYSYYGAGHESSLPLSEAMRGEQVICADFGTRTVAWAFGSIRDVGGVERLHIWGELIGEATNTWDHLDEAKDYLVRAWNEGYGGSFDWDDVAAATTVHCDAAGQWGEHGDGTTNSDVEILYGAGLNVSYPSKNPKVMDRVYSVQNRMRQDGPDGLPLLTVDKARAKYIASCFARQGFDKWGRPEKSKDNLTGKRGLDHGADAVGYACYSRWPVSAPRGNEVTFRT